MLKKFRIRLSTKIVGLIVLLLGLSTSSVVYLSSNLFVADNTALIQQMTADTAASLALQVREVFDGLTENMRLLGWQLHKHQSDVSTNRALFSSLGKDHSILAVWIENFAPNGAPTNRSETFFTDEEKSSTFGREKLLTKLEATQLFKVGDLAQGVVQLTTTTLENGDPIMLLGVPLVPNTSGNGFSQGIVAAAHYRKFLRAFGDSALSVSFLVDSRGRLLAHPEWEKVQSGYAVDQLEIVRDLLKKKFDNGQRRYQDPANQETKLGAFHTVGFAGIGVVTEIPEAKAFEAANRAKFRAMLITLIVLSFAFLLGSLLSSSVTRPVRKLVDASNQIAQGDFKIDLKPKSHDEIADLSIAFNDMAKGLVERDRIKETFNKFHNKEIVDKLLSGEVNLGGEKREATVLFTDLRGFTSMSEFMDPAKVVDMLNEYLSRMVGIIRTHGGVVDKYVGDAIMAIWGVPFESENGSVNAMFACLEMRTQLALLNEARLARGEHALKMGMGLNFGEVIAGNIGSKDRMEYTVIGSTVNVASRLESLTKQHGTDIILSQSIYDRVRDQFVFNKVGSVAVRGQITSSAIYTVEGYIDQRTSAPILIKTPYSHYEPENMAKAA